MEKLFTLEYDTEREYVEIHLNKAGAEFLKEVLTNLIKLNQASDDHFFTPDWGGDELTQEKQNMQENVKLINHLKLFYYPE